MFKTQIRIPGQLRPVSLINEITVTHVKRICKLTSIILLTHLARLQTSRDWNLWYIAKCFTSFSWLFHFHAGRTMKASWPVIQEPYKGSYCSCLSSTWSQLMANTRGFRGSVCILLSLQSWASCLACGWAKDPTRTAFHRMLEISASNQTWKEQRCETMRTKG